MINCWMIWVKIPFYIYINMKKEKIESAVYMITVAVICSLYFFYRFGAFALTFPCELLSDGFTAFNCVMAIITYFLIAWLVGCIIMSTCVVVCEIPCFIFHFNAPRKDEATENAFNKMFRYSIIGTVIVMALSFVYLPSFFDKSDGENSETTGSVSNDEVEEYRAVDIGSANEYSFDLPDGTIEKASEDKKEETVYITPTGSKYHKTKCGSGTYYLIDKQEAIDKGYEPCAKCWK